MGAGLYDIHIEQGSTFETIIQLDGVGEVDVSRYRPHLQMRYRKKDGKVAIDCTLDNGYIEQTGINEYTIRIPAVETAKLIPTLCYYDFKLYINDLAYRILEGQVYINEEVTRDACRKC